MSVRASLGYSDIRHTLNLYLRHDLNRRNAVWQVDEGDLRKNYVKTTVYQIFYLLL